MCFVWMDFISVSLLCDLRNHLFAKIQLNNPDLFWLSDVDMTSRLFKEIFIVARFIENA